ncbi:MAG: fibronectin type III domain-containing protein [Treponema sp.]|jgi:hypothetical protein|nr:fibronectin type III domain-containing protein [Treponema sp.]
MKKTRANYVAFLILPLLAGAYADLFQEKIPKDIEASREGSLERLVNPPKEVVITELPPPAQLFVETARSPNSIRLSWTSVEGAASYVVERAVVASVTNGFGEVIYPPPAEEDFDIRAPFVYGLSYTDKILDNPVYKSPEYSSRYYYRVRAENVGAELEASEATEARWGVLFAPPRKVKASWGDFTGEVRLEWEQVAGAAAYRVYRAASENDAFPYQLARVYGPRYVNVITNKDEQGVEFYYSVAAETDSGLLSVSSGPAMGFSLMEGAPEPPENVELPPDSGRGNSAGEITIRWDPVDDADYYAVYRYSSVESSLTRLTGNTGGTSWTDTQGLKPQVYYYYQIQAINEEDGRAIKSAFSSSVEAFVLGPPAVAEALKAVDGTISIQWYPALGTAAEQALYSYNIYGDTSSGGSFTTLVHTHASSAVVEGDGYIHGGVVDSYPFYRMETVNGGAVSEPGAPFAPPPKAAVILNASRAAYFAGKNPNSKGVYPVKITWKKPDDETPHAYHVYRSTDPNDPGRPVTDNPILASEESGGQFTWYDENSTAQVGTYYYYRVLSLNTLYQGKYYSDVKEGYGALTPGRFFLEYNKTMKSSLGKLTNKDSSNISTQLEDEHETGYIAGTVDYVPKMDGLGAYIDLTYTGYADFYINGNSALGPYFILDGESDTKADMNRKGDMEGTIHASGMYVGTVKYDGITIKGGAAGGGVYYVQPDGFPETAVDWKEGNK